MSILDQIIAGVQADLAARESQVPLEQIREWAHKAPTPKDACLALRSTPGAVSIIGEIKRSTPSIKNLHPLTDPGRVAVEYENGGASIISCVTEKNFFGGSNADLCRVRKCVDIPVLQTDFIISPYQILEARVNGADMVLLTVGLLNQAQLESFIERTESLGMTALVEVESRLELLTALDAGAKVIGVNARNLQTQELDCYKMAEIFDIVPAEVTAVAAAGVQGPKEIIEYAKMGADAIMVGEALLRSPNITARMQELVVTGQHPALLTDRKERVKMHILRTQHELYQNRG
ncbi:indole-3-glycerol phosphate synthase [Gleimia coleocanis DSM 15436]|uniref:indole-3-glycerol-phosphate synthase n=1 Tax=Gleimia coleocanis DSM 15436 TaxID=525245 RepID=C0W0L6_9ACTO|nr:indole-3-glycerol phosphate synthase TrpC [Gleimia coleocanis]EEH64075.1 indole-3-glycerol phosphate synthase [Gleimia coleocanis DSM 15436]